VVKIDYADKRKLHQNANENQRMNSMLSSVLFVPNLNCQFETATVAYFPEI